MGVGFDELLLVASCAEAASTAAGGGAGRVAVSKIADRYVAGKITREEYEREAARLMKKSGRRAGATPVS